MGRVTYLTDILSNFDEQIRMQEEDLKEYEQDLAVLYEPFSGIVRMQKAHVQPTLEPQHNISYALDEEALENLPFIRKNDYHIPKLASFALLIMALFVCFHRATFLDICIASAFIILSEQMNITRKHLSKIIIGTGISGVLDLAWLIINTTHLWNDKNKTNPSELQGINRFVVFLSYPLFFIKFVVIFVYVVLFKRIKRDETEVEVEPGMNESRYAENKGFEQGSYMTRGMTDHATQEQGKTSFYV